MSDPVSTAADVPEVDLDEETVLAFLSRNPDFLARHPDVLARMAAPARWSGDGVVDMQQFLLDRRSVEMAELRDAAEHVIETSRTNMSVQMRTHGAVLSLLAARTWEDMLRIVTQDWTLLLDVDAVVLGLEAGADADARFLDTDVTRLEAGYVDRVLDGGQEVRLFRQIADDGTLFGEAAGIVHSAAVARIHAGNVWPAGLLALGARSDVFHPGQGTEMISFLCRVLESCLSRLLDPMPDAGPADS
jgi:uncharacterized protein YigA (DUF484 family)